MPETHTECFGLFFLNTNYMFLRNDNKYITPNLILPLFENQGLTHVDKVVCGNGFTTAFLNLEPQEKGIDILIFPNVKALQSKELAYLRGEYGDKKIGFIYGDADKKNITNEHTVCFVLDSFKLRLKRLENTRINRILVDEFHTVIQQAAFRRQLLDFENYLIKHYSHVPIVTVTASPNLYSKIDVTIENKHIEKTQIHVTNNVKETISRVKKDLSNGQKVIVFTTDKDVLIDLRNATGELECTLISGEALQRQIVSCCKLQENPESLLTVISSNGFEGLDLYGDFHVYFFEKRHSAHRTFFISNLYQAINRVRNGAKYIEYSRIEKTTPLEPIDKESILKHIESDKISNEQKQAQKHKELNKYIFYEFDKIGKFHPVFLESKFNLKLEEGHYDNDIFFFKDFLDARKIEIIDLRQEKQKGIRITIPIEEKAFFYAQNEAYIKANDLAGEGFTFNTQTDFRTKNPIKEVHVRLLTYFALKCYDTKEHGKRELLYYEKKAIELFSDSKKFDQLVGKVKKSYEVYYKKTKRGEELTEKLNRLNDKEFDLTIIELVLSLCTRKVNFARRYVAHRDYNVTVMLNLESINIVCRCLGRNVFEHDIKTAFPRIAYSLAGKTLPEMFYGKNKEKKIKVNVFLNTLFIIKKERCNRAKENKIKEGVKLGLDEAVMQYLVDKYSETDFKGDFFNNAAFHERNIIRAQKNYLEANFGDVSIVRRHDSILLFDLTAEQIEQVKQSGNNYEYNNVGNWFNYQLALNDTTDFWSE